jgi:hypothetical protein
MLKGRDSSLWLYRPVCVALATGALLMAGLFSAASASAYTNICQDSAYAQPTPVHASPSSTSKTVEYLNEGIGVNNAGYEDQVCQFFNNTSEGRWYMPVRTPSSGNGVGGYIWIQRLYWGHTHNCWTLLASEQAIPSGYCFLTNY